MLRLNKTLIQGALMAALAAGTIAATSAPAAARVVCDRDGDYCRHIPSYWGRPYGYRHGHDGYYGDRDHWRHRGGDRDDYRYRGGRDRY